MLNRLTVSALLRTVILATSFCVVVAISLNAWDSWGRLQVAGRISVIADTSANLFKAMHNLRTDRSTTTRLLLSDAPLDGEIEKYLRNIRDTEMPAMANALATLDTADFAQQKTQVAEFDRQLKTISSLQKEFWQAMGQPKAQRRPALVKEYPDTVNALLDVLEKLSGTLAADVNHKDATIDQLLAIKQTAWLLRNTAGEASLAISTRTCPAERYRPRPQLDLHQKSSAAPRSPGTRWNWPLPACSCPRHSQARSPRSRPPISSRNTALRDRLLDGGSERRKARTDREPMDAR